jgi:hypothetical protein
MFGENGTLFGNGLANWKQPHLSALRSAPDALAERMPS